MKKLNQQTREAVVAFIEKGNTHKLAAEVFGITTRTVTNYVRRKKERGHLKDAPLNRTFRKIDPERLKEFFDERPDALLREASAKFGASIVAVFYALKKLKITLKKKISFYRERDEEHRALWLSAINSLTPRQREKVFYLDEMGVDYRLHSLFARSLRGTPVFEGVEGARIGRANVVALLQHGKDKLTAPFCFEGSCDASVINAYFETQVLADLAILPPGSIIILDNAAFHKNQRTIDLVEKAGHTLLFLPPYSPDLNPIE